MFLTNGSVDKPLQPFDDYDARSLIENRCVKETKQQWDLGHPPQKNERAVRVHGVFMRLMCVLATSNRLQCEQQDRSGEPIGWQRWRHQLVEQTQDQVMVFAQGYYGILHLAEPSLWLGVQLKDVPPDIGSLRQVSAKYALPARG